MLLFAFAFALLSCCFPLPLLLLLFLLLLVVVFIMYFALFASVLLLTLAIAHTFIKFLRSLFSPSFSFSCWLHLQASFDWQKGSAALCRHYP